MFFSFNLACSFTRALTLLTSSGLVGSEDHYSKKKQLAYCFCILPAVSIFLTHFSFFIHPRLAVKVPCCVLPVLSSYSMAWCWSTGKVKKKREGEVCNHLIQTYTHRILLHLATVIVFAISKALETDSLLSRCWPDFSAAIEEWCVCLVYHTLWDVESFDA